MLSDAKVATQQRLCRGGAEANNYFRMECGDFGIEPRAASSYFRSIGFFVDATFSSRFSLEVLHGIGNVNLFAINACFRKGFVQKPAGRADKRFSFPIFLIAGLFADKDNSRAGQTFAEHSVCGAFPEITGLAILCRCFQLFQRCMWLDRWLSGFWLAFRHRSFDVFLPEQMSRNIYRDACIPTAARLTISSKV